jgi:hypothetical protein
MLVVPSVVVCDGLRVCLQRLELDSRELLGCTRVWISKTIKTFQNSCFSDLKTLQAVAFEPVSHLRAISEQAFANCALTRFTVPRSVTILANGCFSRCTKLDDILFEADSELDRISESAFASCSLKRIIIPKSLTVLEKSCFVGCTSLDSFTFEPGSRLQQIDEYAFSCSSLESIVIPNTVVSIAASAFEVQVTDFCVENGSETFASRDGFLEDFAGTFLMRYFGWASDIEIGRAIETIGPGCFSCCKSVNFVRFDDRPMIREIGHGAFYQSSLRTLCIPNSVVSVVVFPWRRLRSNLSAN